MREEIGNNVSIPVQRRKIAFEGRLLLEKNLTERFTSQDNDNKSGMKEMKSVLAAIGDSGLF